MRFYHEWLFLWVSLSMTTNAKHHRLSIAPMLDWTDRHCRYFHRILSPHALLYTEMVTTGAILFGDAKRHLDFNPEEHPVVLQLGGSDPEAMAKCAKLAQDWGYDEVNINVGCPSDRVQSGSFGACLMAEPKVVADCVKAMKDGVGIPVTVKSRIGIDDMDEYEPLYAFTEQVVDAGADALIVHARKAWLKGLSPKENRDIPPLNYPNVYRLKQAFPDVNMSVNGGITNLDAIHDHLNHMDGVMIGREAYHNPYALVGFEQALFDESFTISRHEVAENMLPYIEQYLANGGHLKHITRHMMGLFQNIPGAKRWRRYLSENAHLPDAGVHTVQAAMALVPDMKSEQYEQ